MKIPIEISARHIHLSRKDLERLFGPGYELKKFKDLSEIGEFAARETVIVDGKKMALKVRVVGPVRSRTQLEITATEAYQLGIKVPVRLSGDLKGTPGIALRGPKGKIKIKNGVIIAQRHIHASREEAKQLKLGHRHKVRVSAAGERGVIFENVIVRVAENFRLSMHIDTDEANAAGLWKKKNYGRLLSSDR
ncbi:MAG: phosphate propanoyltransferase [Patescibacteria group bacterium]|jgi:acetate kinase